MESYRGRLQGLTLIEMMLVMVVIGVAVLYSMNFIRDKQRQNSIRSTAEQMNNILQAGIEYHSRYDVWPTGIQDLINNFGLNSLDFCTSWPGNGYPSKDGSPKPTSNAACASNAVIGVNPIAKPLGNNADTLNPLMYTSFSVSLALGEVRDVDQLIHSIAYYLPSATIDLNNNLITIYTTTEIAIQQQPYTYGYITNAGISQNGKNAPNLRVANECYLYEENVDGTRNPMEKHVFLGMFYGLTDYKRWYEKEHGWNVFRKNKQINYDRIIYIQGRPNNCGANQENCTVTFYDKSTVNQKKVDWNLWDKDLESPSLSFYYVNLCVPYRNWQASADAGIFSGMTNFSQIRSKGLIQGVNGQCSGSWTCALGTKKSIFSTLGLRP